MRTLRVGAKVFFYFPRAYTRGLFFADCLKRVRSLYWIGMEWIGNQGMGKARSGASGGRGQKDGKES